MENEGIECGRLPWEQGEITLSKVEGKSLNQLLERYRWFILRIWFINLPESPVWILTITNNK